LENEVLDRSTEEFAFVLADCNRLLRDAFDRRMIDLLVDLTFGDARCLRAIDSITPLRQNQLAELLGIDWTTANNVLVRLEHRGLVERLCDPDDRRAKRIALTKAGEITLALSKTEIADIEAIALADFGADVLESACLYLEGLRSNLMAGNS
jgi:DNA-binding MarR family transcriptional regulator